MIAAESIKQWIWPSPHRRWNACLITAFLSAALTGSVTAGFSGPANAADPFAGRSVWENQACPTCHGIDGNAVVQGVPHFAKGDRLEKSDSELLATISNGTNVMPAWKGLLTRTEMINVVAFIRTLQN